MRWNELCGSEITSALMEGDIHNYSWRTNRSRCVNRPPKPPAHSTSKVIWSGRSAYPHPRSLKIFVNNRCEEEHQKQQDWELVNDAYDVELINIMTASARIDAKQ
ncbi:hypothetical protein KIN20_005304 [Parelaphostrongylus tenuis]|uniref:Uncharacterized protein n=1 Tax=Parelaphostrongylus tenuis TaxID=148309 RepID=A0AAD5M322_PARTN|nr:hypothetical protein KIN20_005304 [Parelaphostrongylus tenuis]